MLHVEAVSRKCTECGLCRKECKFLEKYGSPGSIGATFDPANRDHHGMAFECSLCGLCTTVCPVEIDPAGMFLDMRRAAVRQGGGEYPEHSVILGYERRGTSRRYTWYGLPHGCDTVFFPGCTLSGTRPARVKVLYEHLKETIPGLGIVLDCCSKPSHDLGREEIFKLMFGEMRDYLLENGARNVLVACPNCYRVFREHADRLNVKTVYEVLTENGFLKTSRIAGTVTIHDPCAVRYEESIHGAVRKLVESKGLTVEEMPHHGKKTLCCGEGGSVCFLSPELAGNWSLRRKNEAKGKRIITYCAGCANALNGSTPSSHVLDLLFEPDDTVSGKVKVSQAPLTYWNRIRLKGWLKKNVEAAVTRERTLDADGKIGKGALILRLFRRNDFKTI